MKESFSVRFIFSMPHWPVDWNRRPQDGRQRSPGYCKVINMFPPKIFKSRIAHFLTFDDPPLNGKQPATIVVDVNAANETTLIRGTVQWRAFPRSLACNHRARIYALFFPETTMGNTVAAAPVLPGPGYLAWRMQRPTKGRSGLRRRPLVHDTEGFQYRSRFPAAPGTSRRHLSGGRIRAAG